MREIFMIKFLSDFNTFDLSCGKPDVKRIPITYVIGKPTTDVNGEELTPQKITIRKLRVVVEFAELGITHEFAFTDDVEIFRRNKSEEDADKTTD